MALIPGGQREQTLLAVAMIAVLAAGAYWYFPYQSKAAEIEESRARLEKLVEENQKARTELAKGSVEQMRAELALAQDNLVLLRTLIPVSNEVPALLEQVSTAARREGLDVAAVDPQPVVEGQAAIWSVAALTAGSGLVVAVRMYETLAAAVGGEDA